MIHENWRYILPMWISDLVYSLSDEGRELYKVSPELIAVFKSRMKNIVANVGRDEVKRLCENDGLYLDDEFFDSLEKQ